MVIFDLRFWIYDCEGIITDGMAMGDLRFTRQGKLVLVRENLSMPLPLPEATIISLYLHQQTTSTPAPMGKWIKTQLSLLIQ